MKSRLLYSEQTKSNEIKMGLHTRILVFTGAKVNNLGFEAKVYKIINKKKTFFNKTKYRTIFHMQAFLRGFFFKFVINL